MNICILNKLIRLQHASQVHDNTNGQNQVWKTTCQWINKKNVYGIADVWRGQTGGITSIKAYGMEMK